MTIFQQTLYYTRHALISIFLFGLCQTVIAQESSTSPILKNQISTNAALLALLSPNLTYERTLGQHFSIGLSGSSYGKPHEQMDLIYVGHRNSTNHEINPFGRWYINGTQNRSHFLELFGSINEVVETGKRMRITNEAGYGVYVFRDEEKTYYGLGVGYGYRFLLVNNKLLLEAQFGLRTSFEVGFLFSEPAIVRTGVRVGYRF